MHIVNFDGGGWAIISGFYTGKNPILAYSPQGIFIPDNIESPEVAFWYQLTKEQLENEILEV